MYKQLTLRDFRGEKSDFIIEDFENVKDIDIVILSGDETATVHYFNGEKEEFDSSECRLVDYYDCSYELPLNIIDEFSSFEGSSYECERYIRKLIEGDD